jgi:hypothetical protein
VIRDAHDKPTDREEVFWLGRNGLPAQYSRRKPDGLPHGTNFQTPIRARRAKGQADEPFPSRLYRCKA